MTRKTMLALASVAAGLTVVAGTAIAGHIGSDVKSYTGCLAPGDGVIVKVKEGNEPKAACSGGQTEVHLSGGDITAVAAQTGGGLIGGGSNGAVDLSIRRDCADGQIVKWNGSAWGCAGDSNSTYTAGTGLDLSGSQSSIEPAYRVRNTSGCASGQFANGFTDTGAMECGAPPAPSTSAGFFSRLAGTEQIAGTETVLSENLPAGNYLLFAHVVGTTPSFDDPASGHCSLGSDESSVSFSDDPLERHNANMTLLSGIVHAGGVVALTCTEDSGNFDVARASLAAIELDSIG